LLQIVETMPGTGIRIGECQALRVQDLDLDAAVPTLNSDGDCRTRRRSADPADETEVGLVSPDDLTSDVLS